MKLFLGVGVLCASTLLVPKPREADVFDGVLHPRRIVHVGGASDGILDAVFVDRGDHVSAGDPIAQLAFDVQNADVALARAKSALVAEVEIARARHAEADRRLKRQESTFAKGISTEEELAQARAELRLTELAVVRAEEQSRLAELEYQRAAAIREQGRIESPIDGVVTERFLSEGELLSRSSQDEIVTLAQLHPLVVEVHLPTTMFERVRVGSTAAVQVGAAASGTYTARVTTLDHVIDTASNTFRVRLELPNEDLCLPAGLRCKVAFED